MQMENYFFYIFNSKLDELKRSKANLDIENFRLFIWRPRGLQIWPKGFLKSMKEMRTTPLINLVYWWIMYRVFSRDNDYSILILKDNNEVIHYTMILPANYRFPFAPKKDLILGPVWTSPNYRQKGILYYSLSTIINEYKNNSRQFWWISNEENIASRISIEKAGFSFCGEGSILNKFKFKLFSYYHFKKID